jgi:ribosomal protein S12 methylthiotransferase
MAKPKKTLHVVSLGCSKNQVDTEVMLGRLPHFTLVSDAASADLIIVNTCGFIESAKTESLQTVMNLHNIRKDGSTLVMAGCLSERYQDELKKELVEVDIFTGVGDYAKIDELVAKKQNAFSKEVFLADGDERVIINSGYHAYIKLAEGCNQACSFCAIPSFKGKLHSRTRISVVKEIAALNQKGFFDFSLIAQDTSSYLRDLDDKDGLVGLIHDIDEMGGDFYARVLYLYPSTTSKRLIQTIAASKRVQNYFDMPIQHISEAMLKLMKRGFGKDKTVELLNQMRAVKDSFVRTSVIVGHPGESDADFEELKNFLSEFDFDAVNVFEYSDEEGTDAHEMSEKVDKKTVLKRIKELKKLLDAKSVKKAKAMVGKKLVATVEGESEEHEFLLSAKAKLWAPEIDGVILVNDTDDKMIEFGKNYIVEITDAKKSTLIAKVIEKAK